MTTATRRSRSRPGRNGATGWRPTTPPRRGSGWSRGRRPAGGRTWPTTTSSRRPSPSAGSTASPHRRRSAVRAAAHPAQAGQQLVPAEQAAGRAADRRRAHDARGPDRRSRGPGQRPLGRAGPDRDTGRADLAAALDANPDARGHWDAFPRSARRAILEWVGNAKTGGTRQARIERTVSDAARNVRANQWRQPKHPRRAGLRSGHGPVIPGPFGCNYLRTTGCSAAAPAIAAPGCRPGLPSREGRTRVVLSTETVGVIRPSGWIARRTRCPPGSTRTAHVGVVCPISA
jgi:hypothetical protein